MALRYVRLTMKNGLSSPAKELFENAFPAEERPPYELAVSWPNSQFLAVYDHEVFIGLVDLVPYQGKCYVFFLAIEPEQRGKGYGSLVLFDVKKRYGDGAVFLLAKEAEPSYSDYDLRVKRIKFYERNGFVYRGIKILELGVWYQMLVYNGEADDKDFIATMTYLIGEEMARRYYPHFF